MEFNVNSVCNTTFTHPKFIHFSIKNYTWSHCFGKTFISSHYICCAVNICVMYTLQLQSQCIEHYTALHLLRLLHLGVVHNHRLALYVPWLSCLQKIHDKRWSTWFLLTSCPQWWAGLTLAAEQGRRGSGQCQGGRRDPWEEAHQVHCSRAQNSSGGEWMQGENKSQPCQEKQIKADGCRSFSWHEYKANHDH